MMTPPQRTASAPGNGWRLASHNTSAMPPSCSTAQGNTLPDAEQTQTLSGPSTSTTRPSSTPVRGLAPSAAASPSRPANATTMPRRSIASPMSSGCQWYQAEAAAVVSKPAKNRAARPCCTVMPAGPTARRCHTRQPKPAAPHSANGKLLNTFSAKGMCRHSRWSAKSCWCAGSATDGPTMATTSNTSTAPHSTRSGFSSLNMTASPFNISRCSLIAQAENLSRHRY